MTLLWKALHMFRCPLDQLEWAPVAADVTVCRKCKRYADFDPNKVPS